jgi:acyl-CoA synthetase (AMP-forming)/AMP-acid ligase II
VDVGQILTLTANKFPNRTAIIFENNRFTYQEFNWRANQFAHSLLQLGLRNGEKVAVLHFNSNHFVEAYFGTAKAGGVFTPINFRFAPEEVHYILDHSDARFFLFGEEFSGLVKTIRTKLTNVEFFISVRDGVASSDRRP